LGNNVLPNLIRLSLSGCSIGDDGFITLISVLEQNTSLLHLDLRYSYNVVSERAFLAWPREGLSNNTSLFRFHVAGCQSYFVPPTPEGTARCNGGWIQEMERMG
jgi:hypothetical protein